MNTLVFLTVRKSALNSCIYWLDIEICNFADGRYISVFLFTKCNCIFRSCLTRWLVFFFVLCFHSLHTVVLVMCLVTVTRAVLTDLVSSTFNQVLDWVRSVKCHKTPTFEWSLCKEIQQSIQQWQISQNNNTVLHYVLLSAAKMPCIK